MIENLRKSRSNKWSFFFALSCSYCSLRISFFFPSNFLFFILPHLLFISDLGSGAFSSVIRNCNKEAYARGHNKHRRAQARTGVGVADKKTMPLLGSQPRLADDDVTPV